MARITKAEHRERLEATLKLIAERRTKGEIKRELRRQFKLSARSVERYLARARDELLAESGKSRDEHRCEALAFYRSICGDVSASVRDRLKASERIDKLLGLEAVSDPSPSGAALHGFDVQKAREATRAALEPLTRRLLEGYDPAAESVPHQNGHA